MGELTGKAVVITGAGQGLGRAYALAVAREGADLVINDRDRANAEAVAAEIRLIGGRATASTIAVGTAEAGQEIVASCVAQFGSIYGLINCAALHAQKRGWEESPDHVEDVVRVNVLGVWHTGVAALDEMRRNRSGVIINMVSGAMLGVPEMSIYGASKAAVHAFTTAWASEVRGMGIRIFAISPWARTPMNLAASKELWAEHGPEVGASLAAFLLTERAASLHGRTLRMADGKLSLYSGGTYGPVLGEKLDWRIADFGAVLEWASADLQVDSFTPHRANSRTAPDFPTSG